MISYNISLHREYYSKPLASAYVDMSMYKFYPSESINKLIIEWALLMMPYHNDEASIHDLIYEDVDVMRLDIPAHEIYGLAEELSVTLFKRLGINGINTVGIVEKWEEYICLLTIYDY